MIRPVDVGGAAFSPDGKNTPQLEMPSSGTSEAIETKKLRERTKVDLQRCL